MVTLAVAQPADEMITVENLTNTLQVSSSAPVVSLLLNSITVTIRYDRSLRNGSC
jgi:hypothetical protein